MIIALTGKKGCGKDTVANYLGEKYGFVNYGFADPIKEVGKIVFGFNDEQLEGCLKDTMDNFWGISPREFFQNFGTGIAQFEFPKYFPNMYRNNDKRVIWVKVFEIWYLKKINENPDLKVVISDLRFIHEYEYLKKMDTYFIRIKSDKYGSKKFTEHISEKELDFLEDNELNYVIENNGSKEELFDLVDSIIR